jgi:hypothetical protein
MDLFAMSGVSAVRFVEHLDFLIIRCEIPPFGGAHEENLLFMN